MGIVYFEIVDSLREIIEILFIYILCFNLVKSKNLFSSSIKFTMTHEANEGKQRIIDMDG